MRSNSNKPPTRTERKADPEWKSRYGSAVLAHRKRGRHSQESLAAEIGIDRSALSDIETGKTDPTLSTLEGIADVLSLTLDELVGRTGPTTSHRAHERFLELIADTEKVDEFQPCQEQQDASATKSSEQCRSKNDINASIKIIEREIQILRIKIAEAYE